jgi:ParB family chromosome partitioning protein
MSQITNVPVTRIVPGNNDRRVFDPAKLEELAASIQTHGLAQPITVRPIEGGRFEIVAGERRFRAISQVLQWETAPCIVRELSDEQASAIMLAENTSRADLNPIEEATAYHSRIETFGWSHERVAQVAGVSVDLVKRRVSLLDLVPEVQHLVASGHFPIGHAEALTSLDPNRQRIALRIYRESKNGLPLAHFRGIVNQLLEEQSQDALFDLENFWVQQVQQSAELPTRGKRAVTGAPIRSDLPPVAMSNRDNVAVIMDRYIHELQRAGFEQEAATLGTLYTAMVRGNFMSVPTSALLTKS